METLTTLRLAHCALGVNIKADKPLSISPREESSTVNFNSYENETSFSSSQENQNYPHPPSTNQVNYVEKAQSLEQERESLMSKLFHFFFFKVI